MASNVPLIQPTQIKGQLNNQQLINSSVTINTQDGLILTDHTGTTDQTSVDVPLGKEATLSLQDNSVDGTKLTDSTVDGSKIVDDSITTDHLTDDSVTNAKIDTPYINITIDGGLSGTSTTPANVITTLSSKSSKVNLNDTLALNTKTMKRVVQKVYASSGGYSSSASHFTIGRKPRDTEGLSVVAATITPTSSANYIVIEVSCYGASGTAADTIALAVFRQSVTDAIYTTCGSVVAAGSQLPLNLVYALSGVSGSTTFTAKLSAVTGTVYINGNNSAALWGGSESAVMIITEYES